MAIAWPSCHAQAAISAGAGRFGVLVCTRAVADWSVRSPRTAGTGSAPPPSSCSTEDPQAPESEAVLVRGVATKAGESRHPWYNEADSVGWGRLEERVALYGESGRAPAAGIGVSCRS